MSSSPLLRSLGRLTGYSIRRYVEQGLLVTVNTDDRAMFQTSLAHEYHELARVHGFTPVEIRALINNAVEASCLAPAGRARLRELLTAEPGWSLPA